jgi:hypothetical protein
LIFILPPLGTLVAFIKNKSKQKKGGEQNEKNNHCYTGADTYGIS